MNIGGSQSRWRLNQDLTRPSKGVKSMFEKIIDTCVVNQNQ